MKCFHLFNKIVMSYSYTKDEVSCYNRRALKQIVFCLKEPDSWCQTDTGP